ncbi:MAG: DNA-binding response regulator [Chloroflexi bacterium]|nr:MAG: DNA-binding response regulator [Chloroflexota bacterium]
MEPGTSPPNPEAIRVLLADDHAVVRAGIRQFLEFAGGIQVIAETENGEEACRLVEQRRPDVAVLDIQMPGLSGIEVTRWIRSQGLACGILILTAYDDEPYVQAVLRAGANGYVLKTADPLEIAQAVRDVFAGKSVFDAALAMRLIRGEGHGSQRKTGESTQPAELVEPLTARELEILQSAARGLTNKAIGVQLAISDRTVQNHLAHIFGKLNAASRTEAVMRAVSLGLIEPPRAVE